LLDLAIVAWDRWQIKHFDAMGLIDWLAVIEVASERYGTGMTAGPGDAVARPGHDGVLRSKWSRGGWHFSTLDRQKAARARASQRRVAAPVGPVLSLPLISQPAE
jgi:hypothetical protein